VRLKGLGKLKKLIHLIGSQTQIFGLQHSDSTTTLPRVPTIMIVTLIHHRHKRIDITKERGLKMAFIESPKCYRYIFTEIRSCLCCS
jgi:hypothetical protein